MKRGQGYRQQLGVLDVVQAHHANVAGHANAQFAEVVHQVGRQVIVGADDRLQTRLDELLDEPDVGQLAAADPIVLRVDAVLQHGLSIAADSRVRGG